MIWQHSDVAGQPGSDFLKPRATRPGKAGSWAFGITATLLTLACAFIGPGSRSGAKTITHLPTLTRTRLPALPAAQISPSGGTAAASVEATLPLPASSQFEPALTETVLPGAVISPEAPASRPSALATLLPPTTAPVITIPSETPTPLPTETPMPTETPTPAPLPQDWVFSGVRSFYDQDEEALLLHGDLLNNTGASQELVAISGVFYDGQGQVIADTAITGAWPVAAVSPGGRVPFALVAPGLQSAVDFELQVEAMLSNQPPRQDFEFTDVNAAADGGSYCLSGQLRNGGSDLMSYLVIAVIIFDGQDNILNYGDYFEYYPKDLTSGQARDFELCTDTLNQPVARYELRAWGL